mmetsp:Transcript_11157/g.15190  ORF Transcript_11157/g.15190 Transcript_11157/m.15190 type:complete len:425 (+) Transcript_11157:302-1576(+)|eukprot:CAMPEP_0196572586 /NCGR_PEP_ID=MMETSP1081-20130531/2608_1 /TAXON_ID=36882 /ORGANISM="Pyramimonas amylifera, Strain CCMP720" /LENGTH=424 /DNA_ID=CAMNT_0041889947 /DNA_START=204 /DNA_END=1478 /DNA_ORIENTATION=+
MTKSSAFHYEFEGPYLGPIGVIIGLPVVCYGLVFVCNASGCLEAGPSLLDSIPGFLPGTVLLSWEGLAVAAGWMVVVLLLHTLLPGMRVEGAVLPGTKNQKLTYKLNGLRVLLVLYLCALYFGFVTRSLDLGWLFDNYLPVLSGSLLISFALSFYLYAASFAKGARLASGGNSGVGLYDFFMGRELNPRVGWLDLKEFCELYPGLIGWVMLNLGCAHKQFTTTGSISPSMLLVNLFHLIYVVDGLWFERSILTTMDITSDGFGFMLAFGDLTWVPFTYSLQARILVSHLPSLSPGFLLAILGLKLAGYCVFRGSNSQKDQFRRDPTHASVAHLKTLKTENGRQLMISGWWGISRHINYFGDWLMGLSWCLPCGAQPVAYFYAIYFAVLLIHRDGRDGHSCALKYGKDWDKFKKIVRYHIIPYVY